MSLSSYVCSPVQSYLPQKNLGSLPCPIGTYQSPGSLGPASSGSWQRQIVRKGTAPFASYSLCEVGLERCLNQSQGFHQLRHGFTAPALSAPHGLLPEGNLVPHHVVASPGQLVGHRCVRHRDVPLSQLPLIVAIDALAVPPGMM